MTSSIRQSVGALVLILAAVMVSCGAAPPAPSPTGRVAAVTAAPTLVSTATPTPAPPFNVYASTLLGLDPRVRAFPERVYCPASDGNTVTEIDPATFKVISRFATGRIPHHITPSPDLSTLYVDEERVGALLKIDPLTGKSVGIIGVNDPYNLYFTPDGTTAIVVEEAFHKLAYYDAKTFALKFKVPVSIAGIDHMDFSADGSYFLISAEFAGVVIKFDTATGKQLGIANVGGLPIDIKLSPAGTLFYVANQGRAGVSVVDPGSMTEVGFIPTGRGAHGLFVSRDTKSLYVSNRLAGSMSVISFTSRSVTATWQLGGFPDMIQLSPSGLQLWVSSRYDGNVLVADTRTGQLITKIPCGAGAHGLTYFPAPGTISLGHNGVYR